MFIYIIILQILSKADDNTVMEAVDPEVSLTCMDLAHVRKTLQLALQCTRRHPSERPTMHEVSRVLVSLLPSPLKPSSAHLKTFSYANFVSAQRLSLKQELPGQIDSISDAQCCSVVL